jgi:hypothetical protein
MNPFRATETSPGRMESMGSTEDQETARQRKGIIITVVVLAAIVLALFVSAFFVVK